MESTFADTHLSAVAGAIADPARARMLCVLLDGRARTATELAAVADIGASTASSHFQRLREQGLVEMAVTCAIALSIFALVASGLVLLSRLSVTVRDAAAQPSSSPRSQPSLSPSSSGARSTSWRCRESSCSAAP